MDLQLKKEDTVDNETTETQKETKTETTSTFQVQIYAKLVEIDYLKQ